MPSFTRTPRCLVFGTAALASFALGCNGGGSSSKSAASQSGTTTAPTTSSSGQNPSPTPSPSPSPSPTPSPTPTPTPIPSPAPTPASSWLYVVDSTNDAITTWKLDPATGAPSSPTDTQVIPAVPLAGGPIFHPTALQANATGSLLFASGQTSQAVYPPAYDSAVMPIEISNGVLTLGAPLVVTGGNSTGVAVDPQGDVVFTANTAPTGAGQLAAFTYASGTGALTAASSVGQGTTGGPVSLAIDPTGTFAYCVDTTDSTVQVFGVDTGGFVAGFTSSPVVNPAAPNCVILDPAGQCLYTGNANGTVSAYSIPTPGHLTYVSTTSVEPAHSILTAKVQSLAIDPTGSYIVTANGTSDDVSMLSVSRSSTAPAIVLTLTGTPYSIASATAAVAPVSVTYNANGMTVYVANSAANSISALIVNSTGLAPLPGSPFALPAGDTTPCAVAVSQ